MKIFAGLVAVAAAVVAVIYFSNVAGRRIHRFMSIETMAQRISADLPDGASIQQADKYFRDNGVAHHLSGDGKMYGIVHWIWGSWIVERYAQIVIQFRDGKIEHAEVRPGATFL
jgi:hypothetical protein